MQKVSTTYNWVFSENQGGIPNFVIYYDVTAEMCERGLLHNVQAHYKGCGTEDMGFETSPLRSDVSTETVEEMQTMFMAALQMPHIWPDIWNDLRHLLVPKSLRGKDLDVFQPDHDWATIPRLVYRELSSHLPH